MAHMRRDNTIYNGLRSTRNILYITWYIGWYSTTTVSHLYCDTHMIQVAFDEDNMIRYCGGQGSGASTIIIDCLLINTRTDAGGKYTT
jgi:hypothetical protein